MIERMKRREGGGKRACMRVSRNAGSSGRRVFESADWCATAMQLVLCVGASAPPSGWPTECAKSRCFVRVGGGGESAIAAAVARRRRRCSKEEEEDEDAQGATRHAINGSAIRSDRPSAIWPSFIDGIKNRVGAHRKRVTNECAMAGDAIGVGSTNHDGATGRDGQICGQPKEKSFAVGRGGRGVEERDTDRRRHPVASPPPDSLPGQRRRPTDLDAPLCPLLSPFVAPLSPRSIALTGARSRLLRKGLSHLADHNDHYLASLRPLQRTPQRAPC